MNQIKSNGAINYQKSMKICNEIYQLAHKLGQGNFGKVFMGILSLDYQFGNKEKEKQINYKVQNSELPNLVAIKIEKQKAGVPVQLKAEADIYKKIHKESKAHGFPAFYQSGIQRGHYFMITQLLGPNLSDLLELCGGKFSILTTTVLALQMFQRMQFLHQQGYIYRDVKPQNFLMGIGLQSSVLHLIDFGLAKRYRDEQSNLLRPYKQRKQFNGNWRYASIGSHLRIQQSRRDDLQSLCYVLIYFAKGQLPWQKSRGKSAIQNKQKWIMETKMKVSPKQLCQGLPQQFQNVLEYCLSLEFYSDPDYNFIENQLLYLYEQETAFSPFFYDWMFPIESKTLEKQELTTILHLSNQKNMAQKKVVTSINKSKKAFNKEESVSSEESIKIDNQ